MLTYDVICNYITGEQNVRINNNVTFCNYIVKIIKFLFTMLVHSSLQIKNNLFKRQAILAKLKACIVVANFNRTISVTTIIEFTLLL